MSTPRVLAIKLQLHRVMIQLGSVIQAIDDLAPTDPVELVSMDAALQLAMVPAAPSAVKRLCAPVGADHTSAAAWRSHLQALRVELKTHFGEREFRLKELCSFLECFVDLLPHDTDTYMNKNRQVLVWHQTVHGAISCRPHVWGSRGVAISYAGTRDRWRVAG
jgi:hypothetical protein